MPVSTKTDLALAEAEPISNSSSASVITYLRRGGGGKCCATAARGGVRIYERNNDADTKVHEEGWRR